MPRLNRLKLCKQLQMALILRQSQGNRFALVTWEELSDMTDSDITEDTFATVTLVGNVRNEVFKVLAKKAVEVWIPVTKK